MGPPVFEVTGTEFTVTTGIGTTDSPAISAVLPVKSQNIPRIQYLIKEIVEGEEVVRPRLQNIKFEGITINGKITEFRLTSQNDGLRRGKKYAFYFAVSISDLSYLNEDTDPVFAYEFETPNEFVNPENPAEKIDVMVLGTHYEGGDVEVIFPEVLKNRNDKYGERRIKWGLTNVAHYNMYKKMYGNLDVDFINRDEHMYPAILISRDTILNINHATAYRFSDKYPGKYGYFYATYDDNKNPIVLEVPDTDPKVASGEAEIIQYHYLPAPGEPLVLTMSEVAFADCNLGDYEEGVHADHKVSTCPKIHPTINYSWAPGFHWYPYDYAGYILAGYDQDPGPLAVPRYPVLGGDKTVNEEDFWMEGAWHKNIRFTAKAPEKFNGTVKIDTSKLTPDSGVVTITPSKEVYAYCCGIFPMEGYEGESYTSITRDYLDGNAKLWQWFSTSELGMYFGFMPYYNDSPDGTPVATELHLEDSYYLEAGMRYRIIVTAVGSKIEDGKLVPDLSKQTYKATTFRIPAYTKDAPVLEVTAYDAYNPNKVKFNIKNRNYKTNKVTSVAYAANYKREFDSYMSTEGASLSTLVASNASYGALDAAAIAEVNSKDGYDIEFTYLRDAQEFTLAVMGWNDESRPSVPDAEEGKKWYETPAVATASTMRAPAAEKCDMTELNKLKGDWTATATIRTYSWDVDENGNQLPTTEATRSWKVSIGELKTTNALSAEDYAKFESLNISQADADKQFADFKEQEAIFNEVTLNQNRILCQGWAIDDTENMATTTPWDLMLHSKYGAATMSYLFNDFGPKWFLQTNKKGEIFVPVNYNCIPPITRWYSFSNHHFVLGNFEHGYATYIGDDWTSVEEVAMPIEISEDGNQITIKSTVIEYQKTNEDGTTEKVTCDAYPNVMYESGSGLAFYNPYVVSEVVLTRGWTEPAPEVQLANLYNSRKAATGKSIINSVNYKAPKKTYSITPFSANKAKVVKGTYKFRTREEILNDFKEGKMNGKYFAAPRR